MKDMNIYLSEDLSEMILSGKVFGKLSAIELSNKDDDRISTRIHAGNKIVKGTLYSSSRSETLKFTRYLAAEIRFINYLIHEIGGSKLECIQGFPKLEGLAEPLTVKKANERLKRKDFLDIYGKLKLRAVIECLRNRGCFLFTQS